jgi:malonyl-CoA O-methyltransferase
MKTLSLSGWTQPADALTPLLPDALTFDYSAYDNADAAIAALAEFRDIPRVVAWSMGGQLALKAVAAGVLAPQKLFLIAPPFQFVNDAGFRDGMDPETFRLFRQNYATAPARTRERFHGLIAKGDRNQRAVMEQLRHHPEIERMERFLPWLDALGVENLRGLKLPALPHMAILQGANDAIVPVGQARHIHALYPQAILDIWEETAHAPHFSDSVRFNQFLEGQ